MVKTRKSLWAAGFALLVCILLLIGTTFAWFTDSVSNSGNKIQAGNLSIEATAYDIGTGGLTVHNSNELINGGEGFTFEQTGQNLKTESTPIISETLWEPGKTSAKLLTVRNDGSLAAKVKVGFDTNDEGLQEALWFDFVQVDSNGNLTGQFEQRPMSGISALGDATELKLNANESVNFVLVYGMYETAGNEYQGKSFSADVNILATQLNSEEDGFGNPDYDIDAEYGAITSENLRADLAVGGTVVLGDDITVAPEAPEEETGLVPQMTVKEDTILNLNDRTLALDTSKTTGSLTYVPSLIAVNSGTLTLTGNGTINAEAGNNTSYGINVYGGTVVVNDGNYYGAMTTVQVQKGRLVINGGFFDLAPTVKSVAPEMAQYLINCIDENYKDGSATVEIKGGTFVNFNPADNGAEGEGTNFVADGYNVVTEQHGEDIWYTVVPE